MRTEREQSHTLVRRYKGKHAAEHFQRHAAYMAKRGWTVVSAAQQGQALIVTFCQPAPPDSTPGKSAHADRFD